MRVDKRVGKLAAIIDTAGKYSPIRIVVLGKYEGRPSLICTNGKVLVVRGVDVGVNDVSGPVSVGAITAASKAATVRSSAELDLTSADREVCAAANYSAPRPEQSDKRWAVADVLPKGPVVHEMVFNAEQLRCALLALDGDFVRIASYGAENPAVLTTDDLSNDAFAIIMQVRSSKPQREQAPGDAGSPDSKGEDDGSKKA